MWIFHWSHKWIFVYFVGIGVIIIPTSAALVGSDITNLPSIAIVLAILYVKWVLSWFILESYMLLKVVLKIRCIIHSVLALSIFQII